MKLRVKIFIASLLFFLIFSCAYMLNNVQKREFYSSELVTQLQKNGQLLSDDRRIPFEPRQYIRKISS